jgi:hypothetical protein
VTPDTAAASVVSVPGVVAEYFNFDEHVLGRTSLSDIPARIRAGAFVWIDLDLATADLNVLQDVVPIDDDCRSCLQQLADHAGDVQSEPMSSVRRSERLLHITLVGGVSREGSIGWDRFESAVNLSLTFTAHRTNLTMNRLAVVSTIFLPLTFLCGVYGMNFEVLPEVRWAHGYTSFWVLSTIITIVLLVLLRRLRLL